MGVAAAASASATAALAKAPAQGLRPPLQPAPRLIQRACECGEAAGFSGRCDACEGAGLGPQRRETAHGAQAAPAAPPKLSLVETPPSAAAAPRSLTGLPVHAPAPAVQVAAPRGVQTRLEVSSPDDSAEREAHDIGRRIVQMPDPGAAGAEPGGLAVAPRPPRIFRRASGSSGPADDVTGELGQSTGTALPRDVRGFMEPRFGADFSGVRIHTGDQAAGLSGRLSAQAFTVGQDIYFGRNQFQPSTPQGRELIAHELTHTIQQGGHAHQAAAAPRVNVQAQRSIQRWGFSDALDYFADKANLIPGFRMLTLVLGVNPINMTPVERSAANVLRALVEFLPGGGLIVQALENSGVFEKAGAWIVQQIASLGMTGATIKAAVTSFLNSLSWTDALSPSSVWERAKRIFTEPIDRLIAFGKTLVTGIIGFVKDAILSPLAKMASSTRGWDLLIAVLGKNPITGEPVPRTAETLIPGFLKLIGQEEVWENMKSSHAIPRAWAWFQGALAAVTGFVAQIPDLFIAAFKSLTIEDVVLVAGAFKKVAGVFGGFLGKFIDWAGTAVWNLLEIIFDVVSPGALTYVKKTGAALKSILQNPLPFVGNLVKAAKLGFEKFAGNFGTHLKNGLIDWLTGSLPGVYIPTALTLVEIGKFALSVLGVTWGQIRAKIVTALGPSGEKIMTGLETTFDVVVALVKGGPAAAWEIIKDKLTGLKDMVIDGIISFVVETVVTKAVPKLISMFIPGAGFISAIVSIYDTVMVFVNKLAKIVAAVKAFVDSIVAIAAGQVEGAAEKVESTLGGLVSLAISFLAGFLGLGNVAAKISAVIHKVRDVVDKAIGAAVTWIVGKAKALFGKLFGGGKDKKEEGGNPKWAAGVAGVTADVEKMEKEGATLEQIQGRIPEWQKTYGFTQLNLTSQGDEFEIDGAMSPGQKVMKAKKPPLAVLPSATPTWTPPDSNYGGTGMTVHGLTSAHPDGSPVTASWPVSLAVVGDAVKPKRSSQKLYVLGHLLNRKLGGPGDQKSNLTPITYSANANHYNSVEKHLQGALQKGSTRIFHYEVAVEPPAGGKAPTGVLAEEALLPKALRAKWWPLLPSGPGPTPSFVEDPHPGPNEKGDVPIQNVPPYP